LTAGGARSQDGTKSLVLNYTVVPLGSPFRVIAEQVEGVFELHYELYLLKAKSLKDQCPESDLLAFRGKIERSLNMREGSLFL